MRWLHSTPLLALLPACLPDPVLVGAGDTGDCGFQPTWYEDADQDGHGDPEDVVIRCLQPDGYVADGDDCDDLDPAIWEGEVVWPDADGDGYGADGWEELICGSAGEGQATKGGDCDDADDAVYEDAPPVCGDGEDNNCDEQTDCPVPEGSGVAADAFAWLEAAAEDELGESVAFVGDMNQDLQPDLLVGRPRSTGADADPGQALLLLGPLEGEMGEDAIITLTGPDAIDETGGALAAGGDLDEDGLDDLVLGAMRNGDANSGAVYVVLGPVTGDLTLGTSGVALAGEAENGLLGSALLGGVDLLGDDGVPDLAIGESGRDLGAGAVWLVAGPLGEGSAPISSVGTAVWTSALGGQLGRSLAHVGDIDGDGVPDLAIGAPGQDGVEEDAGALWLVPTSAPSGDVADLALGWVLGPEGEASFGWSVSATGDADGDGLDDLVVGAPRLRSALVLGGAAFILPGSAVLGLAGGVVGVDLAAGAELYGASDDEEAGASVVGAGDMDSDGVGDFCVGAPGAESLGGEGALGGAFCWYGPVDGPLPLANADFMYFGAAEGARMGASLAVADINNLDVPDLLVGAPGEVSEFEPERRSGVFLFLGDGY